MILAFIGAKLALSFVHLHNHQVPEISTGLSLGVIAIVLAITTVASLIKARRDPTARAHAGSIREAGPDPNAAPHEPVPGRQDPHRAAHSAS